MEKIFFSVVLLEDIGPLVCLGTSGFGRAYVCTAIVYEGMSNPFLCTEISLSQVESLLKGDICLRELHENPINGKWFVGDFNNEGSGSAVVEVLAENLSDVKEEYLPTKGLMLDIDNV
jgi:hypothetical protein